jgi:hypothetical protein
MVNNADLPEGWAMPDELAKRIYELVIKKQIRPEDDPKEAINDLVRASLVKTTRVG